MRKNNGRRRHRGQNRRNFNNLNKNTVIESFGPLSQIRGNVQQLNEKYNSLGNDAASNDDKILSESYLYTSSYNYLTTYNSRIINTITALRTVSKLLTTKSKHLYK